METRGKRAVSSVRIEKAQGGFIVVCERESKGGSEPMTYHPPERFVEKTMTDVMSRVKAEFGEKDTDS